MIDLCFLILAVNAHIFNRTVELSTPMGTPPNEAKAEIDTHPLEAETKVRK